MTKTNKAILWDMTKMMSIALFIVGVFGVAMIQGDQEQRRLFEAGRFAVTHYGTDGKTIVNEFIVNEVGADGKCVWYRNVFRGPISQICNTPVKYQDLSSEPAQR